MLKSRPFYNPKNKNHPISSKNHPNSTTNPPNCQKTPKNRHHPTPKTPKNPPKIRLFSPTHSSLVNANLANFTNFTNYIFPLEHDKIKLKLKNSWNSLNS